MQRENTFLKGVPEFAVEVAYSSRAYDLHQKLRVYERHGVKEYLDVFKSTMFPGLWLNFHALLRNDLAAALKTVEAGKRSPEFKRFSASLRKRTRTYAK
jgi:Uma2 family endonuclease